MLSVGLIDIERQTAEVQVMNPCSGEWIKAMQIDSTYEGSLEFGIAFSLFLDSEKQSV